MSTCWTVVAANIWNLYNFFSIYLYVILLQSSALQVQENTSKNNYWKLYNCVKCCLFPFSKILARGKNGNVNGNLNGGGINGNVNGNGNKGGKNGNYNGNWNRWGINGNGNGNGNKGGKNGNRNGNGNKGGVNGNGNGNGNHWSTLLVRTEPCMLE